MKAWFTLLLLNFLIWTFISSHVQAETIKFNEDELARESVLPVFDQQEAVKRKHVPYTGRVQVGVNFGAMFNDPWSNTFPVGGNIFYNFNEYHSVGVVGDYHFGQQSQYVSQIQNSSAAPLAAQIPFNNSPIVKYDLFVVYEFTPYYGKISFTKQGVMNMTFSVFGGAGTVSMTSPSGLGTSSAAGMIGIDQKLFFTRNFGLKLELRAMFYQRTDVVAVPAAQSLYTNTMGTVGVVYLFPNLPGN